MAMMSSVSDGWNRSLKALDLEYRPIPSTGRGIQVVACRSLQTVKIWLQIDAQNMIPFTVLTSAKHSSKCSTCTAQSIGL